MCQFLEIKANTILLSLNLRSISPVSVKVQDDEIPQPAQVTEISNSPDAMDFLLDDSDCNVLNKESEHVTLVKGEFEQP